MVYCNKYLSSSPSFLSLSGGVLTGVPPRVGVPGLGVPGALLDPDNIYIIHTFLTALVF